MKYGMQVIDTAGVAIVSGREDYGAIRTPFGFSREYPDDTEREKAQQEALHGRARELHILLGAVLGPAVFVEADPSDEFGVAEWRSEIIVPAKP